MNDLINVDYDTLIPNNVGLSSDRRVLKALEKWHPGYIYPHWVRFPMYYAHCTQYFH